jgi:hypothetical protein
MIKRFADSSYYLALTNLQDEAHSTAVALTKDFDGTLVTTSWVLTEVGDALAGPLDRQLFLDMLEEVRRPAGDCHATDASVVRSRRRAVSTAS